MDLFLTIYEWLSVLYRDGDLMDTLLSPDGEVVCVLLGIAALVTSALAAVYFYILRNAASENKAGFWWMWLVITFIVNAAIGIALILGMGELFEGTPVLSAVLFGISNGLLSAVFFFVLSCIIKYWSCNLRHIPF
jgi:hypothetical protein